jgi:hypothetical protein
MILLVYFFGCVLKWCDNVILTFTNERLHLIRISFHGRSYELISPVTVGQTRENAGNASSETIIMK